MFWRFDSWLHSSGSPPASAFQLMRLITRESAQNITSIIVRGVSERLLGEQQMVWMRHRLTVCRERLAPTTPRATSRSDRSSRAYCRPIRRQMPSEKHRAGRRRTEGMGQRRAQRMDRAAKGREWGALHALEALHQAPIGRKVALEFV